METMLITILNLYKSFFMVGMFGFGGGLAMLPYIENQVVYANQWITPAEFLDLLAISQATPGPIAINAATFVGFKTAGFIGVIAAVAGLISFSFIIINLLLRFTAKKGENEKTKNFFKTLRPITIGFILAAAFVVSQKVLIDIQSILIAITAFVLLYSKKFHPIKIVMGFGILGIVLEFMLG